MQFYVHKNNEQIGPFALMDLRERLQKGEFSYDDLAWRDGLADWTPLRDLLGGALPDATPHAVAPPSVPRNAMVAKAPTGARIATSAVVFVIALIVYFVIAFFVTCLICGLVLGIQAGAHQAAGGSVTAQNEGNDFVKNNIALLLGGSGLFAFLGSSITAYFMAFSNLFPWCRAK